MNELTREKVLQLSAQAHAWTETSYRNHPAVKGEADWLAKQRLLLADMSLHLLQTALNDGEIELDELRKNLYSILTIADQFLPHQQLKTLAEEIYPVAG